MSPATWEAIALAELEYAQAISQKLRARDQDWIDRELGDVPHEFPEMSFQGITVVVDRWMPTEAREAAAIGACIPQQAWDGKTGPSPYWRNRDAEPVRSLEGRWTRDGFIASPACGARDEYATPSPIVGNIGRQVIGPDRGSCNSFARESLEGREHG